MKSLSLYTRSKRNKLTTPFEKLALTDSETLEEVLKCLNEHISIKTQGACDQRTLFEIIVRAASCGDSLEKFIDNIVSDEFIQIEKIEKIAL